MQVLLPVFGLLELRLRHRAGSSDPGNGLKNAGQFTFVLGFEPR